MSNCSRAIRGWLAACCPAPAVIETYGIVVAALLGGDSGKKLVALSILAIVITLPPIFILTCVLTGIPAAVTIWLGERFRIRSLLFYGCAGGATGALSQTLLFRSFASPSWFFVFGFLAGLDYWFVAGKYAGHDRIFESDTASCVSGGPRLC